MGHIVESPFSYTNGGPTLSDVFNQSTTGYVTWMWFLWICGCASYQLTFHAAGTATKASGQCTTSSQKLTGMPERISYHASLAQTATH
eukprot:1034838-Pyramimonas_sp.AAC.1